MTTRCLSRALLRITVLSVVLAFDSARAQCREWATGFNAPTLSGPIRAWAVFDDGSGPALYAGGDFVSFSGNTTQRVAKWDGVQWTAVGSGTNNSVRALCVADLGSGPALYAAGTFTIAGGVSAVRIAKWDGANWSPLGGGLSGGTVSALAVFDDGGGPAIYAGGSFATAGGSSANRVAKWDGTNWSPVGSGVNGTVNALAVHDDGGGLALYAGGSFTTAGGAPANRVAKWDGTNWSPLGSGMSGGPVESLGVYDDSSGSALYAGGGFATAGGVTALHIARWDGANWSALGSGLQSGAATALALMVFDDGTGSALYVGGAFDLAGGIPAKNVAKWNGSMWSALDDGVASEVKALAEFDSGAGARIYAGADAPVQWDGSSWATILFGAGLDDSAYAATVFDDGSGPALYVGGSFTQAGVTAASRIARWDGSSWSALASGMSATGGAASVRAVAVYDDGGGPALYAGGSFATAGGTSANNVAKWDGANWSPVGGGVSGTVYALAVHDDGRGPALYAGGSFTTAGGTPAINVAKWDGANWSPLGGGLMNFGWVEAFETFDDGSGPALYVGGDFDVVGVPAQFIAKWDGATWSPVGSGINEPVRALEVFDDGGGPALYAGGSFSIADGGPGNCIAKWNGATWSPLGVGLNDEVYALQTFDDGSGTSLYVGGRFHNGPGYHFIAKWNGAAWSALSSCGMFLEVLDLQVFDDGTDGAPDLYAVGLFSSAGCKPSSRIARWHGCEPGDTYCFGDGLDPVVTAQCPCGNFGEPGRGCANSNSTLGGARLLASGSTNPNTMLFTCTGVPNNNLCTFLRGTANDAGGGVFGDGVRCASGTFVRFGQQIAGQGGNASNTAAAPAATVVSGNTRYYQVHYRNPSAGFCPPGLFNFSNGYRVEW